MLRLARGGGCCGWDGFDFELMIATFMANC